MLRAPVMPGSVLAHWSSVSTFNRVQICGATSDGSTGRAASVAPERSEDHAAPLWLILAGIAQSMN